MSDFTVYNRTKRIGARLIIIRYWCCKQCELLFNKFLIKGLRHKLTGNLLCHLPLSSIIDDKISIPHLFSRPPTQWRIQDFGSGGSSLRNSGQSRQYFVTLQEAYTLHEMIEINMKIEICESRTPILGTLLMISLEVDFANILL